MPRKHKRKTRSGLMLKQLAPDMILAICDQLEREGVPLLVCDESGKILDTACLAFLNYASKEQLQALRSRLDHALVALCSHSGERISYFDHALNKFMPIRKVVFSYHALSRLLGIAGVAHQPYLRLLADASKFYEQICDPEDASLPT